MFDQMFESFRRASESSLRAQHEMFRQWLKQWPLAQVAAPGASDLGDLQKRWLDLATAALDQQRALLDATYRAGIELIEQARRAQAAQTPEEQRRAVEDLWLQLTDALRAQAEAQLRDFQSWSESWMKVTPAPTSKGDAPAS